MSEARSQASNGGIRPVATIHDVRRVALAFTGFGFTFGLLLGWWLL